MYTSEESLKLSNLGNGGVEELFGIELQRVLKDVMNPNTNAEAKRSITLKVDFVPDENRDIGETIINLSSKLAGSSFSTRVAFGRDKTGKVEARELFSGQQTLFDDDGKEKVVPITES